MNGGSSGRTRRKGRSRVLQFGVGSRTGNARSRDVPPLRRIAAHQGWSGLSGPEKNLLVEKLLRVLDEELGRREDRL
jgi:hypothetical protein